VLEILGQKMELHNKKNSLDDGYLLHWYEIQKVIGRGGFGITYLAHDTNLDRDVAIKEFMPEEFAVRDSDSTVHPKTGEQQKLYSWGLDRFIAEARTLAKFNHPNIVRVISVFEDNNTAYMVMEYAVGRDLSKVYKKEPRFNEEQLLDTFIPILDGLSLVHNAGFIHRDIKPANIYICDNNSPLLLDFGSARQSIGGKTKALTSLVTFGYAPYEQYNEGSGKQGPWTDIYSLGASIYVGITGKKPVDALFRGGSFLEKGIDTYEPVSILAKDEYSENFLLAVDKALMFKIDERPKNILRWADMLLGKVEAPSLPDYMINPPEADEGTELLWTDTELGYSAEISSASNSGTQGLVDAQGKRNISTTDTVIRVNKPATTEPSVADKMADAPKADAPMTSESKRYVEQSAPSKFKSNFPRKPAIIITLVAILIVAFMGWMLTDSSDSNDVEISQIEQKNQALKKSQQALKESKKSRIKSQIRNLLTNAKEASLSQNYVKPVNNNAFYFYQQILKIEADNKAAIKGIQNIENQLLKRIKSSYENKLYNLTQNHLDELLLINPQSLDAKYFQDQLAIKQAETDRITALLSEAENNIKNNRYSSPENNNALSVYRNVLKLEPENQLARDGIKNIQQHYTSLFNRHIAAHQLKKAEHDIALMKKISSTDSNIKKMQETLDKSKIRSVKTLTKINKKPVKKPVKNINMQQVSQMIGEFKLALQRGDSKKVKRMSHFVPGRKQFVDQLHSQYRKINVKVSNLHLISKEKRALADIELTDLVDVNGNKISPGNWSKFEIVLRYNRNNMLKVYW